MVNQKINIVENKIKEMMDKGLSNRKFARYFKCNEITIKGIGKKISNHQKILGEDLKFLQNVKRSFYNREI